MRAGSTQAPYSTCPVVGPRIERIGAQGFAMARLSSAPASFVPRQFRASLAQAAHVEHQGQSATFDFSGRLLAGSIRSTTARRAKKLEPLNHVAPLE